MFAGDLPSLEGLRHATQIPKLFIGWSLHLLALGV